jgi:signal transduction histidine kinase/phage shock protein PspC (stress-responsive transcriptional regulator)
MGDAPDRSLRFGPGLVPGRSGSAVRWLDVAVSSAAPHPSRPTLTRPRECVLGGVCEGVARHLGWSVGATRWLTVGLALCGGAGVLLYAWLWVLTPLDRPDRTGGNQASDARSGDDKTTAENGAEVRRKVPVPWVAFALCALCGLTALGLGGEVRPGTAGAAVVLPLLAGMIVFGVGAVAWDQFVDVAGAQRLASSAVSGWLRIVTGVTLVAVGVFGPLVWGDRAPGWLWVLFVFVALTGAAVLLAPLALRLWRELIAERTKRVREEERAVMAAHLHDSVLQTLALIQTKAGASSEAARLARAQERELRDWLYSGERHVDSDLVSDLRDTAAALELDYPVRFDVVAVGEGGERSSGELAAAAREAMLNAARHAGGEVSVYIEGAPTGTDVYIRDRGPGFALADVPVDRMGVRESIVGRMRRVGGTASVGPGAGGVGTEVRLRRGRQHPDQQPGAPGETVEREERA